MMLCPACHQVYDQNQKFCEEDGTQLVNVPPVIVGGRSAGQAAAPQPNWASGAVGVVIGLTMAVGAVGVYSALTRSAETPAARAETAKITTAASQPARPVAYKPIETPMPDEEEEAEPSPEPSPSASATPPPAPSPTAPPHSVGASPISTNVSKGGGNSTTKISFHDGSVIEADDAWEDAKGVWYRRGSLVTFIERERINAIERHALAQRQAPEAKAAP